MTPFSISPSGYPTCLNGCLSCSKIPASLLFIVLSVAAQRVLCTCRCFLWCGAALAQCCSVLYLRFRFGRNVIQPLAAISVCSHKNCCILFLRVQIKVVVLPLVLPLQERLRHQWLRFPLHLQGCLTLFICSCADWVPVSTSKVDLAMWPGPVECVLSARAAMMMPRRPKSCSKTCSPGAFCASSSRGAQIQ